MKWLAWVGLCLVMLLVVPSATACTCIPPPPPPEAAEMADAVFIGEARSLQRTGDPYDGFRVTFRMRHAVKGVAAQTVEVWTASNSAACGYAFEQGRTYLVYAEAVDGSLTTGICTRTARISEAQADIDALGIPEEALQDTTARSRCGGLTNAAALQGVFFILLGVAGMRRRWR